VDIWVSNVDFAANVFECSIFYNYKEKIVDNVLVAYLVPLVAMVSLEKDVEKVNLSHFLLCK
jgi:hypothetical protein